MAGVLFGDAIPLRLWVARETFYIILTFRIDFASHSIRFIGIEGIAPPQAHWEDLLSPKVKVIFFGHWSRCGRVNMAGTLFYLVIGIKPPTCFQTVLTHHNNLAETVESEWPSITQSCDCGRPSGPRTPAKQTIHKQTSLVFVSIVNANRTPLLTLIGFISLTVHHPASISPHIITPNCAGQHPQQVPTSNGG